ncbi:MAG: response regulator transcription factor [Acidobacteriales bacterium]|nr:response regulator transcription factor [Terriglobales bacterium]
MSEAKDKILVVDDEPQIGKVLRRGLQARGFDVRVAPDGESALDIFTIWQPDLVISDLAMPNLDGLGLCSRIRKASRVPIIVLSVKGEESTKVEALDSGADDYVIKPFGMDELLARVRALLRRSANTAQEPEARMEAGDFQIDPKTRAVLVRGSEVRLTPKEYDLLLFFLSRHSTVLTHKTILQTVWGANSINQHEYLRVFVGQLRKKIEADPAAPRYLRTEPWIGYRFEPGL